MTVGDLLDILDGNEDLEIRVVQQPNYPLIADIRDDETAVEVRGDVVFLHLEDAFEYYSPEDDEDE
jgi:hypothetical protein